MTKKFKLLATVFLGVGVLAGTQASATTYHWTLAADFYQYGTFDSWDFTSDPSNPGLNATQTAGNGGGHIGGWVEVDGFGTVTGFDFVATNSNAGTLPAIAGSQYYYNGTGFMSDGITPNNAGYGADLYNLGASDIYFVNSAGTNVFDLNVDSLTSHAAGYAFTGDYIQTIEMSDVSCANAPADGTTWTVDSCFILGSFRSAFNPDVGSYNGSLALTSVTTPETNPGTETPEPMSLALLGSALIGLGAASRRFKKKSHG